jgi:hypothetical protein
MTGVALPPVVVEPFGVNANPAYITLPIPKASQIALTPGAASFNDGFVPLNMTPPASGGIPPSGKDMNGILYTLSAYCAYVQAGQLFPYSSTVSTAISGYAKGALLAATDGSGFWFNTVDGNVTNPESAGVGWVFFTPAGSGYLSTLIPSGTSNNYTAGGNLTPSIGILDIDPSLGDATITGFVAGSDVQRVIISNISASHNLTLAALNTGSSAANRIRLPSDLTLLPNSSVTLQYSVGAGKWLASV